MSYTLQVEMKSSGIAGLDGRTTAARRVRDLAVTYTAALGGIVDPMERELILKAAQLNVAAEDMRRRSLQGEPVDIASLVKLENLASRAVRSLNLSGKRSTPAPDLQSYLKARAAAADHAA